MYWTQSTDSTEFNCLIVLAYSLGYSRRVKSYSGNLKRDPNSYTTFSTLCLIVAKHYEKGYSKVTSIIYQLETPR